MGATPGSTLSPPSGQLWGLGGGISALLDLPDRIPGARAQRDQVVRDRYWTLMNAAIERMTPSIRRILIRKFATERKLMQRVFSQDFPMVSQGLEAAGPFAQIFNVRPIMDQTNKIVGLSEGLAGALSEQSKAFSRQMERVLQLKHPGFDSGFAAWIDSRKTKIVDSIDRTSEEVINRMVRQGFEQGWTKDQLRDQIDAAYGRWVRSRPDTIARTEAGFISAEVQERMIKAGPIPTSQLLKTWVSARDRHVRDTHQAMENLTIPYDEPFYPQGVGGPALDHPRDENGPAEEVINCRCVLMYEEAAAQPEVKQEMTWLDEVKRDIGTGLKDEAHARHVGRLMMGEVERRLGKPLQEYLATRKLYNATSATAHTERFQLSRKLDAMHAKLHPQMVKELKTMMSELRDLGGSTLRLYNPPVGTTVGTPHQVETLKLLNTAMKDFPKEWFKAAGVSPKVGIDARLVRDGLLGEFSGSAQFFVTSQGTVQSRLGTAAHEILHWVQDLKPNIQALEMQFLMRRAGPKDWAKGSQQLQSYSTGIRGYKDQFPDEYTGRVYPYGGSEVINTGIQMLYHEGRALSTVKKGWYADVDHTEFMIGILAGG